MLLSVLIYFSYGIIFGDSIQTSFEQLARIPEVRRFQQYIQIDTVTGKDLTPAVNFWRKQALFSKIKLSIYESIDGFPVLILKWPGQNSSLNSIALVSHMDVVPADMREGWSYPPFSAHIDDEGDVYGRGTQEKSVTMQHFEALNRFKKNSIPQLRDIYMVLTPDKETGSKNGIVPFLRSKMFKDMKVGFSLIGGIPTKNEEVAVLYRGKTRWSFQVKCSGPSGDSSQLVDPATSADGSCGRFYTSYTKYRTAQVKLAQQSKCCNMDNITVINFVGPKVNTILGVIPTTINLFYDSFLSVNTSFCEFEKTVNEWLKNAGGNTKLKTLIKQYAGPEVKIDNCNPYWNALQKASASLNIAFCNRTAAQPDEASYITAAGYPCLGISPLINTENLIHAVDERLNVNTFLKGITIFEEIFKEIANMPADQVSSDPKDYLMPNSVN